MKWIEACEAKAYAGLASACLGDMAGSPFEGMARGQVLELLHRGFSIEPSAEGYTDDTLLTKWVAEAIVEGGLRGARRGLVERLLRGEEELRLRGAGSTTLSSINRLKHSPESRAKLGATNGAAIRALPIGLAVPLENEEELLRLVVELSEVTHGEAEAVAAASAIAYAASKSLEPGSSMDEVIEAGVGGARRVSAKLASLIEAAVSLADEVGVECLAEELPHRVGVSPLSVESVPAAFCIFKASGGDLRTAVRVAVEAGGDTDSVASMAGGLCGAFKGPSTIPRGWLAKVKGLGLRELAKGLVEVRGRFKRGGRP